MTTHDLGGSASAESALEHRLRALPKAPGPDPRFRHELRVQLVAAAERAPESTHSPDLAVVEGRPNRRRFSLPFGLPAPGRLAYSIVGAAVAVLLVISGTTYWLAQRALPGDALYGLKKASESVDLSTKQGNQSRGDAYLSISTTRIDEAAALLKRSTSSGFGGPSSVPTGYSASGPLSPRVDGLVYGVLVAGDSAAVTATRLLTTASVASRATHPAAAVNGWLGDQRSKVKFLVLRLPETGAKTAGGAARLLQRDLSEIQVRVKTLTAGLACRTCKFTTTDRFGPLPCRVCPLPIRPSTPRAPTTSPTTSRAGSSTLPPLATTTLPLSVPLPSASPLSPPPAGTTTPSPTIAPPPGTTDPTTSPPSTTPPTTTPPTSAPPTTTDDPTTTPTDPGTSDGSSTDSTDPASGPATPATPAS